MEHKTYKTSVPWGRIFLLYLFLSLSNEKNFPNILSQDEKAATSKVVRYLLEETTTTMATYKAATVQLKIWKGTINEEIK